MIKNFTVTNHLGESLTIELTSPEKSGFIVLSAEGLGPAKADISLTERAGVDGSFYNSARTSPRNVVLMLRFYPGQDIETLRQKSYKYFPLKREITLQIETDNRIAKGTAYVESNEPDIFSGEEGCSISLLFPDSYLYNYLGQITVFSFTTPSFEFPFSNESLVSPLIEFGDIVIETTKSIVYEGGPAIGILMHIHANGAASNITITETITLDQLAIDSTKLIATTGADITAGDDIWISTVKGNKFAILVRGSTTYNILNCLGTTPTWFQLEKGDNVFAYTATVGVSNLEFEVFNDIAYEGI